MYELICVGASWGGLDAVGRLLADIPDEIDLPIVIAQHRHVSSQGTALADLLNVHIRRPVRDVEDKMPIEPRTVYIAPPDQHLLVNPDHTFALTDGQKIHSVRSSANPLFTSAAGACGDRVVAVVLTGGDSDGTDGVQSVKAVGGVVIAQDPATAEHRWMPLAAVNT